MDVCGNLCIKSDSFITLLLAMSNVSPRCITVKWYNSLNSPGCSSCSDICLYPLSHHIHITDDYFSNNLAVEIFSESTNSRPYINAPIWIEVVNQKHLTFDFVHTAHPYKQQCYLLHFLTFCNCVYIFKQGWKHCLCILFFIQVSFDRRTCDYSNAALTYDRTFGPPCRK